MNDERKFSKDFRNFLIDERRSIGGADCKIVQQLRVNIKFFELT